MGIGIRYSESFSMCQREAYTILRFETDPTFRFVYNNLANARHGKIPGKAIVIIPGAENILVFNGTLSHSITDYVISAYKKFGNSNAVTMVILPVTNHAESIEFEYMVKYLREKLSNNYKSKENLNLRNLNDIGDSIIKDMLTMDNTISGIMSARNAKVKTPTKVKIRNASDVNATKMEVEHEEEVENPKVVECKNPHNNCLDCDTYNDCWMRYMPDIAPSFDINEKLKWDLVSLIDSISREYQRDEEEAKNILGIALMQIESAVSSLEHMFKL